jgi:hypothetical protein
MDTYVTGVVEQVELVGVSSGGVRSVQPDVGLGDRR